MSQFDVKIGDPVIQGQSIGLSGASGRITGPHLHFGFMVQGIQTDPIEFMTQINQLFGPKELVNLSSAQPMQNRPTR
jgi:murein DD-endopeptidase MepM/ murein hydrolase activator NlpD